MTSPGPAVPPRAALASTVFGPVDGRPVLALHGINGHAGQWADQGGRLSGIRLLAVDLRGHGRSPVEPPWTLEQHVADVIATLDEWAVDRLDVIGYSFGGAVATWLAASHPKRVRRLVLLDPAVGLPSGLALRLARELSSESFESRAAARAWLEQARPAARTAEIDNQIATALRPDDDGRGRWCVEPGAAYTACSEMARTPTLPKPGRPALLVRAAGNPDGTTGLLAELDRARRGDWIITSVPSGHHMLRDAPAEVARLINDFLS
jgi:lipase